MRGVSEYKNCQRYFMALGEFVHAFATVEMILNFVLPRYMKLDNRRYKAIFSALRVDRTSEYFRQILRVGDAGNYAATEILYVLDHLVLIQRARNFIVHFGPTITFDTTKFTATNSVLVTTARMQERTFTLKDLRAMRADLYRICDIMLPHILAEPSRARRLPAWRYKPPEQG